jgi:isopenicillin-N epimerase
MPADAGPAGPAGYAGFGSFFSDNVEELVAQSEAEYTPPLPPFTDAPDWQSFEASPPLQFGTAAARAQFLIDFDTWTFVNHGAFGAASRLLFNAAHQWRVHCETQPLLHIDRLLFPAVVHSTRVLAAHLGARPGDVVFGPNATTLLNAVIFSAPLAPGDVVYSLSVGYGSVKKMLKLAAGAAGASWLEVDVRFPLSSSSDLVELVRCTLPASTKLAVFDAVTSNTALALPVAELAAVVRAVCPSCRVLIDAAHALGTSPQLNIPQLGVDFWVSNCHKHLCSPRGCAVLWAAPHARSSLRPVVISHGTGSGFTSDFIWDGCRDYAPVLAIPQTLRWWAAVGMDRAVAYMRATLAAGVEVLLGKWQTHTLVPMAMSAPTMALVRLPVGDGIAAQQSHLSQAQLAVEALLARRPPSDDGPSTSADAKGWQDALFARRVECPVKCIQGRLYVRISAHVYNMVDDYTRLGDAVLAILTSA